MMESLRNIAESLSFGDTLAVVMLLLTIFGLVFGIIKYLRFLNRKKLSFDLINNTSIIEQGIEVKDLQFLYKNRKVNSLYLAEVVVENTGYDDIEVKPLPEDLYHQDGVISFMIDYNYASYFIDDTSGIEVKLQPYAVDLDDIEKTLIVVDIPSGFLKVGEWVRVKLISEKQLKFDFNTTRILDVKVKDATSNPNSIWSYTKAILGTWVFLYIYSFLWTGYFLGFPKTSSDLIIKSEEAFNASLVVSAIVFGLVAFILLLLWISEKRKRKESNK